MKDESEGARSREIHMPADVLESVRKLNHRFLHLASRDSGGWKPRHCGLSNEVLVRVSPLSADQMAAASSCPYALFDLQFHDDSYWQSRLEAAASWRIAETVADAETLEFVKVALFFAWHLASTSPIGAHLMLGMNQNTCSAFRRATIDRLPSLAASEAGLLTTRWSDCARYWTALLSAARGRNLAGLRRIQLYGLQLAAASRLA